MDEINNTQNEINNIGGEINNIQNEINPTQNDINNIQNYINNIQDMIKYRQDIINNTEGEIYNIKNRTTAIDIEKDKIDHEGRSKAGVKNTIYGEVQELLSSNNRNKEGVDINTIRVNDYNQTLQNIEKQINEKQPLMYREEQKPWGLVTYFDWTIWSKIEELKKQAEMIRPGLIYYQNELNNYIAEYNRINVLINSKNNDIRSIEDEINSLRQKYDDFARQRREEEQNYSIQSDQLNGQRDVVNYLNEILSKANTDLNDAKARLNNAQNRLNDANARLNNANTRLNDQKIALQRGEIIGNNITSAYNNATKDQIAAYTAYQNRSQSAVSFPAPAPSLAPTSFSPATISEDQKSQARLELAKYQAQLETDTRNNDTSGIENSKNRIQQYQNIIAGN